ncbi:hypothetical protein FQZ97_509160 [compost metagenome]
MTKPISVSEENIEDLLAQMEAELGGAAPPPVPTTKPAPAPTSELDDLAALETLELSAPAPAAAPAPTVSAELDLDALEALETTSAKGPLPTPEPEPPKDDELEGLEALGAISFSAPPASASPVALAAAKPKLEAVPPAEYVEPAPTPTAEPRVPPEAKTSVATGLDFYVDEDAFRVATSVNEVNLDQAMMEQADLRSHYGAVLARAEAQHARVKARFEVKEAQLYDSHRRALADSGEKVTEKAVENAVKLDPAWLTAKNLVIEAESIAGVLKALNESLKDRRDMIIQLGADRRDDAKGQLRILAAQQTREQAMNAAKRAMNA